VIEINANPCISPDAGFVAATERAGIPYDRMIERILEHASLS
jgi:D-alanine-D-alanine ligase